MGSRGSIPFLHVAEPSCGAAHGFISCCLGSWCAAIVVFCFIPTLGREDGVLL